MPGIYSYNLNDELTVDQRDALRLLQNRPVVQKIARVLHDPSLYLVGGIIREALLGLQGSDLDFATALPSEQVLNLCQAAGIRIIPTGLQHGTVRVVLPDGECEITTFRAVPDKPVAERCLADDLTARDFSINTFALSAIRPELWSVAGALTQLNEGRLVAVGAAESRFREDPLRLLRMIRFGPAAGRTIADETFAAAQKCAPLITRVAVERIQSELNKIIVSPNVRAALLALKDSGLLAIILPEALPSIGFEQNEFHTEDVWNHIVSVVERAPQDPTIRLAALFHDLGKPHTLTTDEDNRRHFYSHEEISAELAQNILERLKYGHRESEVIVKLVAEHMRPLECGAPGARRILRDLAEDFDLWRGLKIADKTPTQGGDDFQQKLSAFDALIAKERERLKGSPLQSLAVDGNDLVEIGLTPGPALGAMLKFLLEKTLDDPECNHKEQLLKLVREKLALTK